MTDEMVRFWIDVIRTDMESVKQGFRSAFADPEEEEADDEQ